MEIRGITFSQLNLTHLKPVRKGSSKEYGVYPARVMGSEKKGNDPLTDGVRS